MKIILSYLTLFLLFTNSHLYAQVDPKVYVKGTECSTQYDGGCFYNLEPTAGSYSRYYYYVPVVDFDQTSSTVPYNATQTYAWTVRSVRATNILSFFIQKQLINPQIPIFHNLLRIIF